MSRTHGIYKVRDGSGKVVFRGSVQEISEKLYCNITSIYKVARGDRKTFLKEYTLEYDGEEAFIREPEEGDEDASEEM